MSQNNIDSCGPWTILERPGLGYLRKAAFHRHRRVLARSVGTTKGRDNHKAESMEFFKTFPDNHLINHPYKVEISQGEWTCTVADFTGTMKGPMKGADGKMISPTNK